MRLPAFDYTLAHSLDEALEAAAQGASAMCGGTELLAAMAMGLLQPDSVVSLRALSELRVIEEAADGALHIGSCTPHVGIERSRLALERFPILHDVVHDIGNARVRAFGTIGGNLAFGDPRSDILVGFAALSAQVELRSQASGSRVVPVREFVMGPYWSDLEEGELISRITIPTDAPRRGVYEKIRFSERPVVAAALTYDDLDQPATLVIGSVQDEILVIDDQRIAELDPGAIAGEVDPDPDSHGSVDFKRHLTETIVRRCITRAQETTDA